MIRLSVLPLAEPHSKKLGEWQKAIDDLPDYAAQVAAGKTKFSAQNKSSNATFAHVKAVLNLMCQGARRCGYCEDSVADEVEHIQPKDLYPETVFAWENYLYACGPCNGPKNNQWAVLRGRPLKLVDVTRPPGAPVTRPEKGSPALINPRTEDPLGFLFLDLLNTFTFTVMQGITAESAHRAVYTIKVLRLNDRDYLVDARRTAFGTYRARLAEYVAEKKKGATTADLDLRRDELKRVGHQTVWREMQRQQGSYPKLKALFAEAPEALGW